jgi:catechol 2,3-dioxygenase-like lactoylglutathione lyase family enzyme
VIQHVALEVLEADAEACAAFWALLGFRRIAPPPTLDDRAVWVQAGDTQVHLLFAEQPVVPREGHVAVVAGDYEATLDELRAAGFAPVARTEHWGSPRAFVSCPAGHRVELMAFAPA